MSIYSKLLIFNNINCIFISLKYFYFDFLLKFNLANLFMLPNLDKVIVTITFSSGLKNELDVKIINALNILDFFFFKKSEISALTQKYLHKAKSIVFVGKSTLTNKLDIFQFFFLFFKLLYPSLKKRYIFLKFKVLKDGFIFFIPDISSIYGIPEELKKDRISIKVSIYFNKFVTKKFITFFLYYFGFRQVVYEDE